MKRWGNLAGSVVAFLAIAAVLYFYSGDLRKIDFGDPKLLPALAQSIAIYVAVVVLGSFNWKLLLTAFGHPPLRWAAERQLLLSQIAKYIPGNVAQFIGRAAMAIQSGVPGKIVGFALVTETAATVVGGLLAVAMAVLAAPQLFIILRQFLPDISGVPWLVIAIGLFLALVLASAMLLSRRRAILPTVRPLTVLAVTLLFTLSVLLLGLSLHVVAAALSANPVPVGVSIAVFATAWLAGFATPGAPGGLGVRETVITLGLAPVMGGGAALSVALVHRGASVIGDLLSFALGLLLPRREIPLDALGTTPAT